MNIKKELGIYYTTNVCYIFQNIPFLFNTQVSTPICIIEPFFGNGDLIHWCNTNNTFNLNFTTECYDIRNLSNTIQQDTLLNPPTYKHKYVITNPPFLAYNKKKTVNHITCFKKYPYCNDLYKCFIMSLIKGHVEGGILILPLNFWCSLCSNDILLRKMFIELYDITHMNIFYERVFKDTTCNICSFRFIKKNTQSSSFFNITCYPFKTCLISDIFKEETCYLLKGGLFIYKILSIKNNVKNPYTIQRYNNKIHTNDTFIILCQVIDMSPVNNIHIEKINTLSSYTINKTSRAYIYISILPHLPLESDYDKLCSLFNTILTTEREQSLSLFLSSYREYYRKRLSFTLLYNIIYYILYTFF